MRVLNDRPVLATNATGFLVGVAMFGSFILIPQFVQTPESSGYGFGMSVTEAGLMMLPSAVAMLFAGPIGGALGSRVGFRTVLAGGTLFASASFVLLAVAHGHPWEFALGNVLMGIGISFAFAAMANLIVAAVDPKDVGIATGINTVTRTVGGAFGSALVTALLTARHDRRHARSRPRAAYSEAFTLSAIIGLLAFGAALSIPRAVPVAPRAAHGAARLSGARPRRDRAGSPADASPFRRA